MSPWAARIKSLLDAGGERGLSDTALARACGIRQPSVWQWFNDTDGKQATKMISGDNLVAAAKYLGTTAEWIMTGRHAVVSQSARLDGKKIIDAIKIAMGSSRGLTAETVVEAYELLLANGATSNIDEMPPTPDPKGPSGHGVVEGRNSRIVADSGRTKRARKA